MGTRKYYLSPSFALTFIEFTFIKEGLDIKNMLFWIQFNEGISFVTCLIDIPLQSNTQVKKKQTFVKFSSHAFDHFYLHIDNLYHHIVQYP